MLLSSSYWFRVTGSGTFQVLMMMMVVALFAVQSSMAHPSSTSTIRPSIHEYQEKQANRSALTLSGSLANSSKLNGAPLFKSAFSSGNYSFRDQDAWCVGKVCSIDCFKCENTKCNDQDGCACLDGYEPNSDMSGCVRVTNPTTPSTSSAPSTSSTASTPSTSSSPGTPGTSSTSNTPSTSSIPTTTSSTTSTSPSTTTSTELPSTTTSSWFSKNTILIVGILVFVLVMALTLLYIFGCHCCRKEAKIGDTSGANYRRQAYQPSPANSKVTSNVSSKANSKATSKAASKATSKATSKINSAKTTSKH